MLGSLCFLGTGSSNGVPVIGCKCFVCNSLNRKNVRARCSVLLRVLDKIFLIDAGPDHRMQALSFGLDHIDGFILTHTHYDHVGGLDEIKIYSHHKKKIPFLLAASTFTEAKEKFPYLFSKEGGESPFFSFQIVENLFEKIDFEGVPLECLSFFQGKMQVMGIKIGDLAYVSDIKTYDDHLIKSLKGVKTLILSAIRNESSGMHFSVQEALSFANKVKAETTYLTHIAHELDHEALQKVLPQSVFVAYDGLTISFQI